jgi:uncharacterized protein
VASPVDVVWDFFQDVPAVAGCMPGVEVGEPDGDGAYPGTMKTKLGPIAATFQGTATITDANAAARTGAIAAKGIDKRQGSRVRASVGYELEAQPAGTSVAVTADITLQGSMAQFGRTGILQEVSSQMTREFARCVEAKLAGPDSAAEHAPPAATAPSEVDGLRLFRSVVAAWFRRVFRRGAEGGRT